MWRDIEMLVGMLAEIEGIQDLAMSTGDILLADYAAPRFALDCLEELFDERRRDDHPA